MAKKKVNASKAGFDKELEFIEDLSKYCNVNQNYYRPNGSKSPFVKYKISDLCTNLKLYIGGRALTENDCNLTLQANNEFLSKITQPLYGVDKYENVAIQSKLYTGSVKTSNLLHDVTNILVTPHICKKLIKNSIVISDNIPDNKVKDFKKYSINLMSKADFEKKFDVLFSLGRNSLVYTNYNNRVHENNNYKIGKLIFAESSFLRKKVEFLNLIDLDNVKKNHLKQNISRIDDKINFLLESKRAQITHLNPEYYIYSTQTGKIDRKGLDFLKDINGLDSTYSEFEKIISNGEFFKNFNRIDHKAYAIKEMVEGKIKWEMLDRLKQQLRKKELVIPHKKIQRAVDSFVIN